MCIFGSNTQQSKSTTKPAQDYQSLIKSLGNLATTAASRPLKQYTGPRVAGFTPDQTAGMNAVRASRNSWQPYLNTASQYAARGANPITNVPNVGTSNVNYTGYTPDQFSAEGLAQFYNPYQQNVIDSSLANIQRSDRLQQEDLLGRAISSGNAFGGDRAGLAAAELARSQGLARNQAISQLEQQGYNTALGAFQNQQGLNSQAGLANAGNALSASQQNAANQLSASNANAGNALTAQQANQTAAARAAEQFGGLGQQAQQQGLAGAGALLQSGGLQQQLQQNQLDIPYQDFQQRQQYPQQQAQWLLNTLMGIPSNAFGTTTTSQQPGPSALSQIAGGIGAIGSLGLGAGTGGLFKRGGGISDYANGGKLIREPNPRTNVVGETSETPETPAPVYAAPVTYAPPANYGINIPMLNPAAYAVDMNAGYEGPNLTGFDYNKSDYPPRVVKLPKDIRQAIKGIDFGNIGGGSSSAGYGSDQWAMQTGGPGAMAWRELFRNINSLGSKPAKKALGGPSDEDPMDFSLAPLGDIRIPQPAGLGATEGMEGTPARNMVRIPTDQPIMSPKQVASNDPTAGMDMPPDVAGIAAAARGPAGAPQSKFSQFLDSPTGAAFQGSLAMLAGDSPNAGVNIGNGLLYGVEAYKKAQAAKAAAAADRDPEVIKREDGSVHLFYPDSKELVEILPALPQAPAKRSTTTVNGKVVDTETGEVVYADPASPDRKTVVVNNKLVDEQTGEVLGDYAGEDVGYTPADNAMLAKWGIVPKPGQAWGIGEDGKPVMIYDALAQIADPFEKERYLRNDFDKIAQNYRLLQESYGKIETGVKSPSAAGDVALIFSYMRMLDPASTVREGEFATAQQTAGLPETIVNQYNRLLTGERLGDAQRADFANTAKSLLDAQYGQYTKTATQYRELASQYGLNPDRVVNPETLKGTGVSNPKPAPAAPPLAPYSITDPGLLGPPSTFSPNAPLQPGSYHWSPNGIAPVSP